MGQTTEVIYGTDTPQEFTPHLPYPRPNCSAWSRTLLSQLLPLGVELPAARRSRQIPCAFCICSPPTGICSLGSAIRLCASHPLTPFAPFALPTAMFGAVTDLIINNEIKYQMGQGAQEQIEQRGRGQRVVGSGQRDG